MLLSYVDWTYGWLIIAQTAWLAKDGRPRSAKTWLCVFVETLAPQLAKREGLLYYTGDVRGAFSTNSSTQRRR
jgi:hypothetical protein